MARNGVSVRKDTRKLKKMIQATPQQADRALRGAAQEITNEIVLSFGESVSAPGDPPGVDTGALRASMGWMLIGPLSAQVFDGVEYGQHLEFGTEDMAARPFFSPVFYRWERRDFARFLRDFMNLTP